MVTDLGRGFKDDLRETILTDAEDELVEQYAENFVDLVHARLRSYGNRHDYDVESTIDSFEGVDVSRTRNGVHIEATWASDQMDRWEFGTDDHTVTGDPLSFVWEDPPQWVREEFDQARDAGGQFESGWRVFLPEVDVSGLPESRAIRDSLNGLRRLLRR
jgi:hypothetical protein